MGWAGGQWRGQQLPPGGQDSPGHRARCTTIPRPASRHLVPCLGRGLRVPLSISGPAHRTGAVKGIWGMRGPGVCSLPPTGRKQPRGRAEAARRPRSSDGRPIPAASASHIATLTRHEGGRRILRVLGHQCSWRRPPVLSPPENPGVRATALDAVTQQCDAEGTPFLPGSRGPTCRETVSSGLRCGARGRGGA